MGNVIAPIISFDDNSIIRWKGTPICTIKQAADFYNVPEGNIRKNYERNKERYREGEHFETTTDVSRESSLRDLRRMCPKQCFHRRLPKRDSHSLRSDPMEDHHRDLYAKRNYLEACGPNTRRQYSSRFALGRVAVSPPSKWYWPAGSH